jgi:uncharacterized Zn finger protein (UPF0148 family)
VKRLFCIGCGERRYKEGDLWCAECRRIEQFVTAAEQAMRERLIVAPRTVTPEEGSPEDE